MTDQKPTRDIIDVLLLLGSLGAVSLGLIGACCFLSLQVIGVSAAKEANGFFDFITPLALILLSLTAFPGLLYSIHSLRGRKIAPLKPFSSYWLLLLGLFPIALIIGNQIYRSGGSTGLIGALAHLTAAAIPVIIVVILAYRLGPQVSPRRFWGQLLMGAWVIPFFAIILELMLMLTGAVFVFIGLLDTPEGKTLLEAAADPELWSTPAITQPVLAFFEQPLIIVLFLSFVILLVPLLEEILKSLAIWPLFRRRPSASESFLSGVLAGAGFALIEALFLSPPGPDWIQTMVARAGATCMHSFTAGLTCWGIGQVLEDRRWRRLVAAYLCAVALHGIWNAAAIGVAYASMAGQGGELPISQAAAAAISAMSYFLLIALTAIAGIGIFEIPRRLMRDVDSRNDLEIEVRNTPISPTNEA